LLIYPTIPHMGHLYGRMWKGCWDVYQFKGSITSEMNFPQLAEVR
jgi:hypothetical protein